MNAGGAVAVGYTGLGVGVVVANAGMVVAFFTEELCSDQIGEAEVECGVEAGVVDPLMDYPPSQYLHGEDTKKGGQIEVF